MYQWPRFLDVRISALTLPVSNSYMLYYHSMASLVSVIIPCYNQARFLAEAIESVLGQDYPEKEVIVVNDGSPDREREVASRFAGRIVYIEQENKGVSGARNTGIKAARGEYVTFLDGDDLYLPHALTELVSYLDNNPDTALVCSDSLFLDDTGLLEGFYSSRYGKPGIFSNFRWDTVNYCPLTSTVAAHRYCFDKFLFEEGMVEKSGGEDWLMWVRLSLDFNMAYLDRPLARYRLHNSNITSFTDRIHRVNREASALAVNNPRFGEYPAHFRAKLLFYRFATAWRVEPKTAAFRYFLRALCADPLQIPYGLTVVRRGIANTLRRRAGKS